MKASLLILCGIVGVCVDMPAAGIVITQCAVYVAYSLFEIARECTALYRAMHRNA